MTSNVTRPCEQYAQRKIKLREVRKAPSPKDQRGDTDTPTGEEGDTDHV